jgi:phosphate transport system substrate-binding protein
MASNRFSSGQCILRSKQMQKTLTVLSVLALSFCCLQPTVAADQAQTAGQVLLDPNLPIYHPLAKLEGDLKLGGSNTLSHVAAAWSDSFKQFYPNIKISIAITGSRKAVASVSTGATNIGLLSRTIHQQEVADFHKTHGYVPTVLTPCLERTAIFVHKDNPIQGLTFAQVDAIYSSGRKRGATKPIRSWGELGVRGALASQPIAAHGRSHDTGSQVFFQNAIMLGGTMRKDLRGHDSNAEMLTALAKDPTGIAFAGLSYANSTVRAVPLAFAEGEPFVPIDSLAADHGRYPLVRRLQLVVNHNSRSKKKLSPIQREFIKYAFSRQGQEDVVKAGFQAIPAPPARVALDAVGLGIAR